MKRFTSTGGTALHRVFTAALALAAGSVLLIEPSVAIAAGGGDHGLNWTDFAFRIINFIIFVGMIYYLAGKKIAAFFTGRKLDIKNELDDLSTRRDEAEAKLAEVEARIANMDAEREQILAESRKQGENLKASIIAAAEKRAEQIAEQAQHSIEAERRAALAELREEMAEAITAAAAESLAKKLDDKTQQQLIDQSLNKVVLN